MKKAKQMEVYCQCGRQEAREVADFRAVCENGKSRYLLVFTRNPEVTNHATPNLILNHSSNNSAFMILFEIDLTL